MIDATTTEWTPSKSPCQAQPTGRLLRCTVLFWYFVVLVLLLSEAVLVLDRFCDCIVPPRSIRGLAVCKTYVKSQGCNACEPAVSFHR